MLKALFEFKKRPKKLKKQRKVHLKLQKMRFFRGKIKV